MRKHANLKVRRANARAQAKVARARARVCRGLATPLLAGISVFLQPRLQSPFGLSDVDLATAAGDTIYHIGLFTRR